MLTMLAKLFKALNSESSVPQIALAIALGMIIGLTPTLSLHNVLILLLAFIIRVNLGAFFVAIGLFSLLSLALASTFAGVGESLLTSPALQATWQMMYQSNALKLAHFHNTLTLGSFVVSLMLTIPVYFLSKWLIDRYRYHLKGFIEKFRIVQALKGSRFYKIYESLTGSGV